MPKYQNDGDPRTSGFGFGITVHPDTLRIPYRRREPCMVFANSMSDLFHARVPISFGDRTAREPLPVVPSSCVPTEGLG